jgi:ATP-dependent Clp protease ATP-binding subunit ClpC
VLERFTDEARRVVVVTSREARLRNHNFLGTEHILLGLIREDECRAAKVLASLEISLPVVRAEIEQRIERGDETPSGRMPFTPSAKRAFELSQREALQLGDEYIDTEHLLLGFIPSGKVSPRRLLVRLGASLSRTRQQVMQPGPDDAVRLHPLLVGAPCQPTQTALMDSQNGY